MKVLIYIYSFFCSLKLAVFTLSALIILFAVGTFYESAQGRLAAQEVIYRSIVMTLLVSLLALNIIAVMIDRWPWKKRHIGFLLAHFGIIFVIAGSLMTRFYGVDGNLRLALGEKGGELTTSSVFLMVYSSFDAKNLTELYREQVYFFRHSPTQKKPHLVQIGSDILKVNDFYPAATVREDYQAALRGGPALRFQIEGSRVQIVKWMFKPPWMDKVELPLGPAQILLLKSFPSITKEKRKEKSSADLFSIQKGKEIESRPSLLLVPKGNQVQYQLRKSGLQEVKQGVLEIGSVLKTGWMDFQFRLIEYLPKALPNTIFTPQKRANDRTNSAIQVEFKGEKRWMGLNSHLFFFDEDKVYVVAYVNERKSLGFQLKLKNFKVVRYPSSFKAASYESEVQVGQDGMEVVSSAGPIDQQEHNHLISMNHPLKWAGYTIYQSGFEEDDSGKPVASVFAINKDPGRFIKYFGSLLIVLGSFILFFRRNWRSRVKSR
ncbi:MAG: cytochrome c biogenesis protein ResB [Bdellovibrionales bacterium]|nr:cytochrome c biogenesis protein ResB [Bdellovibrionales bacterium]